MTDPSATPLPPAGWYPDHTGLPQNRWWDGAAWTDHIQPIAAAAPVAYTPTSTSVGTPAADEPLQPLQAPREYAMASSVSQQGNIVNAYPGGNPLPARVPEGTPVFTPAIWVLSILPLGYIPVVIMAMSGVFTPEMFRASLSSDLPVVPVLGPLYFIAVGLSWLLFAIGVILALLDYRILRRRGFERPFHWALAFIPSAAGVYVIGRSVVARRRAGRGISPMWIWIGATVLYIIVTIAVTVGIVVSVMQQAGYSNA